MKSIPLDVFLNIVKGTLVQGNPHFVITNVCSTYRTLQKNTAFFYLYELDWSTSHFNQTHVIITRYPNLVKTKVDSAVTIIKVDSGTKAYWDFIDYYRGQFDIPVFGVTGTCGKTTTTEMIKSILQVDRTVKSTILGLNALAMNLPYLTSIDDSTEAFVLELGLTHPENILTSCRYLKPTIGIITNIEVYHTLGCGTLENYIQAKAEILEGLGNKGTLILNKDNANIKKIDVSSFQGEIIYFSVQEKSDYQAVNLRYEDNLIHFDILHQHQVFPCSVIGHGAYNVYNALAAIAAVSCVGIDIPTACQRLANFGQLPQHIKVRQGYQQCTVIDDTWNNSPLSMNTALDILQRYQEKNKVAVLGAMYQLGDLSTEEHRKIGVRVAQMDIDALITLDDVSADIARAALEMGMSKEKVFICQSGEEAWAALDPYLNPSSTILLKFSYYYHRHTNESLDRFYAKLINKKPAP